MSSSHTFNDYFVHNHLFHIEGVPNTQALQRVIKELQVNARTVNTSIGGGQYGHLFLILADAEWLVSNGTLPVVLPADLGPFTLTSGFNSPSAIAIAEKAHETSKRNDEKYLSLDIILKNQLLDAIGRV